MKLTMQAVEAMNSRDDEHTISWTAKGVAEMLETA
jgi:hypothetical protein